MSKVLNFKEAKIFKDKDNKLIYVPYNPKKVNYFTFIAEQRSKKCLTQVIITTNLIIHIVTVLVNKYGFRLIRIDLMTDNRVIKNKVQKLITRMTEDPTVYISLVYYLMQLSEEQAIDVLRVALKKDMLDVPIQIKVQANGLFFIDKTHFCVYAPILLTSIVEESPMLTS